MKFNINEQEKAFAQKAIDGYFDENKKDVDTSKMSFDEFFDWASRGSLLLQKMGMVYTDESWNRIQEAKKQGKNIITPCNLNDHEIQKLKACVDFYFSNHRSKKNGKLAMGLAYKAGFSLKI